MTRNHTTMNNTLKEKDKILANKKYLSFSYMSASCTPMREAVARKVYKPLYKIPSTYTISHLGMAGFIFEFVEPEQRKKALSKFVAYHYNKIYDALITKYLYKYIFSPEDVPNVYIGYSSQDKSICIWVCPEKESTGLTDKFISFSQCLEDLFRTIVNVYVTTEVPRGKDIDRLKQDFNDYAIPIFKKKCIDLKASKEAMKINSDNFEKGIGISSKEFKEKVKVC